MRCLLANGTEVDATDEAGQTALFSAAGAGHEAVVQYLLAQGADVDAKDKKGRPALWYATHKDHLEVVQLLVDKLQEGTDSDAINKQIAAAFSLAKEHPSSAVKTYLEGVVRARDITVD